MASTHSFSFGNDNQPSAEARRAALAGTRAHIANEQFAALVTFLVDLGVCSGEQAGEMIVGLATKLERPSPVGWQQHAPEIRIHADWLKRLAARVWARHR